jgi:hypothetical protein
MGKSLSIVSESWRALPVGFDLGAVDLLSRLVEAYVLHDKVICFADARDPLTFLTPEPEAIVVEERGAYADTIHPLLEPFFTPTARTEFRDIARLLRMMRSGGLEHARPGSLPLPSRARPPREWLSAADSRAANATRAELGLSEQMRATYYPPAENALVVSAIVGNYEAAASVLLKRFTDARSAQLLATKRLMSVRQIDWSPPLLFAYAAASAETLQGFARAVEDLRNDSGARRLRNFVKTLAQADPADQIELAAAIREEFKRILGGDLGETMRAAEVAKSVPALMAGNAWGILVEGAVSAVRVSDILRRLVVRRHLAMLRKVHRRVPSIGGFFGDLIRLFPNVTFNERHLAAWLMNPDMIDLSTGREAGMGSPITERELKIATRQLLAEANREIARGRRVRQE